MMRNSYNNPLVRKIKRHAALTTLFKKADVDSVRKSTTFHPASPTTMIKDNQRQVVQASLVTRVDPGIMTYPQVTANTESTKSSPVESFTSRQASLPGDQPAVKKAESPEPAVDNSTASPITDEKEWRRLQAILKRHAAAEEVETPASNEKTASGLTAKPHTDDRKQGEVGRSSQQNTSTKIQPKLEDRPAVSDLSQISSENKPARQVSGEIAQSEHPQIERRKSEMPAQAQPRNQVDNKDIRSESVQNDLNASASRTGESIARPLKTGETQRRQDNDSRPDKTYQISDAPLAQIPQSGDKTGETIIEQESSDQDIPLQEIWPVSIQKKSVEAEREISSGSRLEPAEIKTALPYDDSSRIHRLMERAEITQPTSSKLEIIPPRRPRPVNRDVEPSEGSRQEPPGNDAPPISMQLRKAPQNESEQINQSPDLSEKAIVQTEIGPLPQDLWQLLDKPIPTQRQNVGQVNPDKNLENHISKASEPQKITGQPQRPLQTPGVPEIQRRSLDEQNRQETTTAQVTQEESSNPTTDTTARSSQSETASAPAQPVTSSSQQTQSTAKPTQAETATTPVTQQSSPSETSQAPVTSTHAVTAAAPTTEKPSSGETAQISQNSSQSETAATRETATTQEPVESETQTQPAQAAVSEAQQAQKRTFTEQEKDELSLRVYSEIKRRLSIEWERLRRK